MIYKDFNNINIQDYFGVSRVAEDTLILAKFANKLKGEKVLDLGTGTGFIAIYLASFGRKVEGADISSNSIKAASENAKNNRLKIKFYESDLFDSIKSSYDLIVFNPPVGTPFQSKGVFIEKIKYLFPRSTLLYKFIMLFFGGERKKLIKRFLSQAMSHINVDGSILMFVTDAERPILKNYSHKIVNKLGKSIAILKAQEIKS